MIRNLYSSLSRILFLFPILLLALSSCENDIAVVNTITAATQKLLPTQSDQNVEILYSDSALVRAKLSAKRLDHYAGKKPYLELPKGMEITFYDEHHKEQTKLTADYGIGFDNGEGIEHMEAKRNVVVVNQKGDKLNTEHLIWNAVTKKIFTDEFVKITTKDEVIWGDGLTANQDFSDYTIKNVKGQINVKDEDLNKKNETKHE